MCIIVGLFGDDFDVEQLLFDYVVVKVVGIVEGDEGRVVLCELLCWYEDFFGDEYVLMVCVRIDLVCFFELGEGLFLFD